VTPTLACERWLTLLAGWEGGVSNRAADRGGETWYGITVKNHPEILDAPEADRPAKAREIAVTYWDAVHADELPAPLGIVLADWSFNSPRVVAVKRLQQLVGTEPDGKLGDKTILAAKAKAIEMGGAALLARALHAERVRFLRSLIANDPTQVANLGGWWRRTTELAFELA
jgi:lysozyme family protein